MSTILKALRRLEEQKADAAPKPLRDEVVLAPSRGRRSRRGLGLALAAGLALAITGALAIAFVELAPTPEPAPIELPPAVSASPESEAVAPAVEPETARAPEAADPHEGADPDFDIVRPDPAAAARALTPTPLPRIVDEPRAPSPSRAMPEPAELPAEEELPVYEEEPLEEAPAPRVARPGTAVRVARTQWHPSPERRIAWVEVEGSTALREVRQGERVGPYVVREIEPAGVVLVDGGVELRREVGR
jgi:hypothetical protein